MKGSNSHMNTCRSTFIVGYNYSSLEECSASGHGVTALQHRKKRLNLPSLGFIMNRSRRVHIISLSDDLHALWLRPRISSLCPNAFMDGASSTDWKKADRTHNPQLLVRMPSSLVDIPCEARGSAELTSGWLCFPRRA